MTDLFLTTRRVSNYRRVMLPANSAFAVELGTQSFFDIRCRDTLLFQVTLAATLGEHGHQHNADQYTDHASAPPHRRAIRVLFPSLMPTLPKVRLLSLQRRARLVRDLGLQHGRGQGGAAPVARAPLGPRATQLLDLMGSGWCGSRTLAQRLGVSTRTINREIARLVANGRVQADGSGSRRQYRRV